MWRVGKIRYLSCKNGWTDRSVVLDVEWGWHKKSCIRWTSTPDEYGWKTVCGGCWIGLPPGLAMRPVPKLQVVAKVRTCNYWDMHADRQTDRHSCPLQYSARSKHVCSSCGANEAGVSTVDHEYRQTAMQCSALRRRAGVCTAECGLGRRISDASRRIDHLAAAKRWNSTEAICS